MRPGEIDAANLMYIVIPVADPEVVKWILWKVCCERVENCLASALMLDATRFLAFVFKAAVCDTCHLHI